MLGTDRGGRTAALLYSFTGTCKHHDIDPFAYLQDILRRLPAMPPQTARRAAAGRLVRIAPPGTTKEGRLSGFLRLLNRVLRLGLDDRVFSVLTADLCV